MTEPCYRNEFKHIISFAAMQQLASRLSAVLEMDENSNGKPYTVKSLYFDTIDDSALKQKIDGDPYREKFRLRCYNQDFSFIRLEKKVKDRNKGYKLSTRVTREEAEQIIAGDLDFIKVKEDNVLADFYIKSKISFLRPKVIMEYEREAYVFGPGNTRVTIDSNVRTCTCCGDFVDGFFGEGYLFACEDKSRYLLEVKYDRFLPEIIRDIVQVNETTSTANSKYLSGRMLSYF